MDAGLVISAIDICSNLLASEVMFHRLAARFAATKEVENIAVVGDVDWLTEVFHPWRCGATMDGASSLTRNFLKGEGHLVGEIALHMFHVKLQRALIQQGVVAFAGIPPVSFDPGLDLFHDILA